MNEYVILRELIENWLKENFFNQDVLLLAEGGTDRHDKYIMYYPDYYTKFVTKVATIMQEWGRTNEAPEINNGIDMWNYCMKEKDFGMLLSLYKKVNNGDYIKIY